LGIYLKENSGSAAFLNPGERPLDAGLWWISDRELQEILAADMQRQARRERVQIAWLKRYDKNGNGWIDPNEQPALAEDKQFQSEVLYANQADELHYRFDSDENGALDINEATRMFSAHQGHPYEKLPRGISHSVLFIAYDENKDRVLDRQELTRLMAEETAKVEARLAKAASPAATVPPATSDDEEIARRLKEKRAKSVE